MLRSNLARGIALAAVLGSCVAVAPAAAQAVAPPPAPFKKVSALVALPDFLPGLGTLYVNPATLPAGPFLAYDHAGHLVSTIYMIPIAQLDKHQDWSGLSVARQRGDHVDIMFNAGHPGVAEPHYHIILWYISKAKAEALAK